jgi:uncharacterized membrane protein (GlpM family)
MLERETVLVSGVNLLWLRYTIPRRTGVSQDFGIHLERARLQPGNRFARFKIEGDRLVFSALFWASIRGWPKQLIGGVLLAFLFLLVSIAFVAGQPDAGARELFIAGALPLFNTLATVTCGLAARHERASERRTALAWSLLALAQLILAAGGMAVWMLLLGLGVPQAFIYAAYLCYYPFMLLGLLYMPARPLTRVAWSKTALDLAIVLLAGALMIWHYWLDPLAAATGAEDEAAQLCKYGRFSCSCTGVQRSRE